MKDIGQRIYEKDFEMRVYHDNDDNGHLNNARYFEYCEQTRRKFLEQFDWSDKLFNEKRIAMNLRARDVCYKFPLVKGDDIRIKLEILFTGKKIFFMNYTFYNKNGEIVFTDKTKVVFVNSENKESVDVPDFFIEKLRYFPVKFDG